jgi:phosphotransferase system enzyme I (PtsP)
MFPMVASIAEFDAARAILDRELERHRQSGADGPTKIQVGTMLEVPSLIWQIDSLARRADFISVGSNDLMQFLFAVDRGNTRVANRYDTLSPTVLRVLHFIVTRCRAAGVELSICGEIAGQPLEAMALLALGFRNLSMSASGIGPVKAMVRTLKVKAAQSYVEALLTSESPTVRENLRAFARDHAIALR